MHAKSNHEQALEQSGEDRVIEAVGDGSHLTAAHFAKLGYAERTHLAVNHPDRYTELRDEAVKADRLAQIEARR